MTDAPEPEPEKPMDSVEASCLTVYATQIYRGAIRWRNDRWEFAGTGEHLGIQEAANKAAAFLRRMGMLGKGKA